jgi:hypothetical protein
MISEQTAGKNTGVRGNAIICGTLCTVKWKDRGKTREAMSKSGVQAKS